MQIKEIIMTLETFKEYLNNNNALPLNKEWLLFTDLELYSLDTAESVQFNNLDELLAYELDNETVGEMINRADGFYFSLSGGRGQNYNAKMGGGFNHAGGGRKGKGFGEVKFPVEFNGLGTAKNYQKTLAEFRKKYGDAEREYGITVDDLGYVYNHIQGDRTSVPISGGKGQVVIHNHPNGGNFSDTDLINTASDNSLGIVAVGKKNYSFMKTNHFKAKEFIKAVKKAQWPERYSYDEGADWWLRQNAKKYGYKYTAQKGK